MKRPVYECDNCGERHGHRTEMAEVPLRHSSDIWTAPRLETLHVCLDCDFGEATGAWSSVNDVTDVYEAFLVDSGEVVGLMGQDGQPVLRKDLSVETHGNVAIIRDAMDAVEGLL
ncbi:hypothetical protein M197_gp13 [Haloarcula hispanica tailed virus 2]|uniref:Uncharacterized protein n=1 Tax=Haloarcula hispanica tailed virus 2 TaxID=1273751 RepID=R4TLY7_9CAUD|nr:hypothetical protein M197_gp13 [Haloarcula hispanica tailed virus 2]AGM11178.1 hypothetical protein HHTV2_12 [Haloarcula hispanica tailed virus 2]